MARLFADLVECVHDARVGEVGRGDDRVREPGHQHRFEAQARVDHRGDLLTRERGPLLTGEAGELGQLVDRQQLVGQDLTGPDLAGQVDVGVDDLAQRRVAELLHPAGSLVVGAGHRGGHGSNL